MKITKGKISDDEFEYQKRLEKEEKEKISLELSKKRRQDEKLTAEKEAERKKLEHDRVELLKLKQGVSDGKLFGEENKKHTYEKPKGKAAIENFWYLNKTWVILASALVLMIIIIVQPMIFKVQPDFNVNILPIGYHSNTQDVQNLIENYMTDINGDGKKTVSVIFTAVAYEYEDAQMNVATQTKFISEITAGDSVFVVSDSKSDETLNPQEILQEMDTLYPDNSAITKYGLKLDTDKVKQLLGWEDIPEGSYLGVKKPEYIKGLNQQKAQALYDEAIKVFDKMVNDLT